MSKKISLLLFLHWAFFLRADAQAPDWAWAKSACSLSNATSITSITTDPAGNIFIGGNFRDSALFGNGVYHPTGTVNLFIAKYDSAGTFLWMRQARGANNPPYDLVTALCTDAAGNCYGTGFFNGVAVFDHDTVTSLGQLPDVFVVKYGPAGNVIWLRKGTGPAYDYGYGIGLDADGYCYVSGSFQQSISFGNLNTIANNSSTDIFLLKLDGSGNIISAHGAGGSADDQAVSLAVDAAGNCWLTGTFNSTDMVIGSDTLNFTNSDVDAFVARFDSSGTGLWGRTGSGPGNQEPAGIAADPAGNCYVTGVFKGDTMALDTSTLITFGYYDFFTARYDVNGNLSAAGHQGSATFGTEFATAIAADSSGNFYTTGQFRNPAIFSPDTIAGTAALNIFIAKFDSTGSSAWVKQSGSASSSLNATAIHRDESGNLFITGSYEQSTTFGNDSLLVSPGYGAGYYIAKLGIVNTTGIYRPDAENNNIQLYPNPASGRITITGMSGKSTVQVFDISGRKIYSAEAESRLTLNVSNLYPGIYLVEINTGGSVWRKKFIRQ